VRQRGDGGGLSGRTVRPYRELAEIARAGGSIVIPPEKTYSAAELVAVAEAVKAGGGRLVIQDAGRYATDELVTICDAAPTQVYVYE
jgi:hypothetical protein